MYRAAHHLPSLPPSLKHLLACLFGSFTPELVHLLTRSGSAVSGCCFLRYRHVAGSYTLWERKSAVFGSFMSELDQLWTCWGIAVYRCCSSHHRHLENLRALLEHSFTIVFASILPQLLNSLELRISTAYVSCLPHCPHLKASLDYTYIVYLIYAAICRKNDPNCYFPFAKLPTEITLMIASYLDPISRVCYKKDISSLLGPNRCTQRLFHAICIPTQPTCRCLSTNDRDLINFLLREYDFNSLFDPISRLLANLRRWSDECRASGAGLSSLRKPGNVNERLVLDCVRRGLGVVKELQLLLEERAGLDGQSGIPRIEMVDLEGEVQLPNSLKRVRLRFRRRVLVLGSTCYLIEICFRHFGGLERGCDGSVLCLALGGGLLLGSFLQSQSGVGISLVIH